MYLAADFYAPLTVSLLAEGSAVTFWVVNERRTPFSGQLTYSLYSAKGECLFEARRDVVLTQMSVTMPIYEDMSRITRGIEDSVIISWELRDDHGIVSEGARTVVPYKHFAFEDCEIRTEITGMGRNFVLKLDADAFIGGVYLSLEDMSATFSKNYFDYLGTSPIQITIETTDVTVPATLMKKLRIIRASDIGK
jgi:hypothetical protein